MGTKQDTDRLEGVHEKYQLHINYGQSDIWQSSLVLETGSSLE